MSHLELTEADIKLMLAAKVHVGTKNVDANMRRYVWGARDDGIAIINLGKTWEKLNLAARVIAAIENPADVIAMSSRSSGQRAVFKFASHTGSLYVGTRYTPGTLTNQIQKRFVEPRLLIVTDPHTDHQPILEASYMNLPVVAFCDTDSNLSHVDIAIPCNNKGDKAIALMYWMLARQVLRMKNAIPAGPWSVMVDLFVYRNPEESKEEKSEENAVVQVEAPAAELVEEGAAAAAAGAGWGDEPASGGWDVDVATA